MFVIMPLVLLSQTCYDVTYLDMFLQKLSPSSEVIIRSFHRKHVTCQQVQPPRKMKAEFQATHCHPKSSHIAALYIDFHVCYMLHILLCLLMMF